MSSAALFLAVVGLASVGTDGSPPVTAEAVCKIPAPSAWVLEYGKCDGEWFVKDDVTLTFGRKGEGMLENFLGGWEFLYTLGPGSPPRIDLTCWSLQSTERNSAGVPLPAVYCLDGDRLTVCLGMRGRPAKFSADDGEHCILLVLKRKR
jgi:uncharacterized protein (TIGR03067 family)